MDNWEKNLGTTLIWKYQEEKNFEAQKRQVKIKSKHQISGDIFWLTRD